MIGYLYGRFLASDDDGILVESGGVGYSVLVSARMMKRLVPGRAVELFIHTNLRENALELFGFASQWEKKVFHALTSVSGVGPKTAVGILGAIEPEAVLTAIVREDRTVLTSVSGIGKKTAERLILELAEKAQKLLSDRPRGPSGAASLVSLLGTEAIQTPSALSEVEVEKINNSNHLDDDQGMDLWTEALQALVGLGYREADALSAIKLAAKKFGDGGQNPTVEKLIMTSLQMMSRGLQTLTSPAVGGN